MSVPAPCAPSCLHVRRPGSTRALRVRYTAVDSMACAWIWLATSWSVWGMPHRVETVSRRTFRKGMGSGVPEVGVDNGAAPKP